MYGFQKKNQKKVDLLNLRANFDEYKKRLVKNMEKDRNREKQLLR